MKGMELSERFFRDWAEPELRDACGYLLERCAAGLLGPNSQAIGYDDELSRDHAWGPFFVLWTPDDLPESELDRLRQTLESSLPDEFLGFPLSARRDTPYNMSDFVVTRLGDAQEFFLGTRGLPAEEGRLVAALAVADGHEAEVVEFLFAPVGDGHLGREGHGDIALGGRTRVSAC